MITSPGPPTVARETIKYKITRQEQTPLNNAVVMFKERVMKMDVSSAALATYCTGLIAIKVGPAIIKPLRMIIKRIMEWVAAQAIRPREALRAVLSRVLVLK